MGSIASSRDLLNETQVILTARPDHILPFIFGAHFSSIPLDSKLTGKIVQKNDLDHVANDFQYNGKSDCKVQA